MNNQEYKKLNEVLIDLCCFAVNGTKPELTVTDAIDFDSLYAASKKQMIAAMIGQVLQSKGISSPAFKDAIALAQRNAVILNNDLKSVTAALEDAGIWYMPLKGTVLKNYYPHFAMREMCDCDILFDETRAAEVKCIMENLGFQVKLYGEYNDDDYFKSPVSSFEMHRALFRDEYDKKIRDYYKDVKNRLVKDTGSEYRYHFLPEDFYIFMIAHEHKHYNLGGTGLRSLIDTYVYLHSTDLNMDYVVTEVEKLGISDYEKQNRELSLALFTGETLTVNQEKMLNYIISSGAYGTLDHYVKNKVEKTSKFQYLVRRVCGPIGKNDPYRKEFKKKYASFFKNPVLLPILPFYRFFKALKASPKRIKSEINALWNLR